MARRFNGFAVVAVLMLAAGCTDEPPVTPVVTTTVAAVQLCSPDQFDPAAYPAVVAAGRAAGGGLSDDVAAYSIGLLPPDLLSKAGVTVEVRESSRGYRSTSSAPVPSPSNRTAGSPRPSWPTGSCSWPRCRCSRTTASTARTTPPR